MAGEVLWTWPSLCEAVGAAAQPGPDVTGVSLDSRTLNQGDLFVALAGDPGPRFHTGSRSQRDGHDFVGSAAARGAVGALVARPTGAGIPEVIVTDTLDALWALGAAARRRMRGRVFAVTGSSGKTTAKTFLSAALSCPASLGSLNNFWGVPLSLARTPANTGAAVFEVGTNHPGEIAPLAKLVNPDIALVLNVHHAHVEYFGAVDALRREKLSIREGLVPGGVLVVPDDLDIADVEARPLLRFGESPSADVQLVWLDAARLRARYKIGRDELEARIPGGGRHRALTLAAVMACLLAAHENPGRAAALGDDLVPRGRGARRDVAGIVLIDDSYNANPSSLRAALEELARETGGRRYALIGEMRELGDDGPRLHRELAPVCATLDGVFCVGPGTRPLFDALPAGIRLGHADGAEAVPVDRLTNLLRPGDRLLVKGSNRVFWVKGFVDTLIGRLEEHAQKKAAR